ncbi:SurA N-terminal domain-containing protein [Streptomyces sp. NPDC051940]|uniref:SurA N-terminal domain-containing protein n=1 Tax=Streptomyces sp. NPDC051940 TaxID=3155675 RepID=UPI00344701FF
MRQAAGPKFAVLLALLGAPLLTACGDTPHPGAAATLGGERITVAQVQSRVDETRDAQNAAPNAADLIAKTPSLQRSTLYNMIFDRVLDRALVDTGAGQPDAAEVQASRAALEERFGSAEALEAAALQGGIAPSQLDAVARQDAGVNRLLQVVNGDQAAAGKALEKAADELHIDVNPRFGEWNATTLQKGALQNSELPWLKPVSAGAPAAAEQQQQQQQ